jgi:hypothetical protein
MPANLTCPYCQATVNVTDQPGARTLHCPHCLCDIEDPRMGPASEAPNLLRDIRRGGRSLRWVVWALLGVGAALCVSHIMFVKFEHTRRPLVNDPWGQVDFCPGFLGLDVLAVITLFLVVPRALRDGERAFTPWRTVLAFLLIVGATIAVVVLLFAVCTAVS